MKLYIQVLTPTTNGCVFDKHLDIPDEFFTAPGSDIVTLEGVKTAIDWYLYEKEGENAS